MKSMNAKVVKDRNGDTIGVKSGAKDDLPTVIIDVKSENAFDFHIAGPRSRTEEIVHFVRNGCYMNMWFEHKKKSSRKWKRGFLAEGAWIEENAGKN